MNKNKLLFFASLLLIMSVVTWSCKDEFSAEDQLRLQAELEEQARQDALNASKEKDSIALSIQVYNASVSTHSSGGKTSGIQGAQGLTVKLAAGGTILSQTTGAEGIVNFWVQPGAVSGTVSGTGFATANFTLTLTEAEDNENPEGGEQETNASVSLPVFANAGATTARVTGLVTFEGSLLNSTQENVPNGTTVTFRPTATSLQAYYLNVTSTQADIDAYSFEGTFTASTTNGVYTINLPAGANGLEYTHSFNEFTADQSIAINNYVNEPTNSVRDVVTIRTAFGQNVGGASTIPTVAPVQLDVQAPPASGTGATVNLRLEPQTVTSGVAPSVLAGGSGYPISSITVPVTINGGDYDASVPGAVQATITANTNILGQVVSLNISNPGFGYRTRPTLTIGGGGTGAVVRLNWSSVVADDAFVNGPSTITAGGSGYLESLPPNVFVTGLNTEGEVFSLNVATSVTGGSVTGIAPGATVISSISSAVVVPPARVQATATATATTIGELGALALVNTGSGYADSPAPTVTVRGLRGGVGALVVAMVDENTVASPGPLSVLNVVNRGSGYSTLANANFPTAPAAFSPASAAMTLSAGQERVLDAYYGSGRRSRDVQ